MATFDHWVQDVTGRRLSVRFTKAQAQALHSIRGVQYFRVGYRLIPCPGPAHENAHIDNCGLCAPRWGYVEIPEAFETLEAYREHLESERGAVAIIVAK